MLDKITSILPQPLLCRRQYQAPAAALGMDNNMIVFHVCTLGCFKCAAPRASFEPQSSIKLHAPFALRAPCVNIGNFIGFLSKSTRPRPQWPIWLILDKNPYFWAWFSKTSAPHRRLRFWVLSLRITGNQQNALWGRTLEDTWNFVQYSKIQGKLVV